MPPDRMHDDENRPEIVVEQRRSVAVVSAHGTAASASERSKTPECGLTEGKADLKVRTYGVTTILESLLAGAWLYLNGGAGGRDGLVALLEAEVHLVAARSAELVLDGEAAADLALPGLVGLAVERGFRLGVVAPVPDDGGAVELFEVVRAADELGGEDDAGRSDADGRLRAKRYARTAILLTAFGLRLRRCERRQ